MTDAQPGDFTGVAGDDDHDGPAPVLNYDGGSQLEQLHAEYVEAKAAEKAAVARAKTATDRLKLELTETFPNAQRMCLQGSGGPTLELQWVPKWQLDSKKLKLADPETYVRYAYATGAWRLAVRKDATP